MRWSVSGATSLSIDQGIGSVSGGSLGVTPTVTTTYTLTASNAWGTATRSVTVTVLPPTISSFTASPSGITLGQGSTLAWSTAYATGVSISNVGAVSVNGSTVVNPTTTTTTTYTLTATSSAGTTTAQVTVALAAPVINSLSATYTQITSGSGTTLVWNVTGAASLSLSPGPGTVTGNNATVFPAATTAYTLTASNAAGSVTRNITITVDGAPVLLWTKSLIYGFGQLLCEEHASGPALIYIQSDQVGSPNWITDANGALINYTKNLPFGERLADANPNAPKSLRRFTNHEEDTDFNAIYMQAREYLAGYGKFAQVDPAYDQTKDDPESWNLYNYVTNNPVTHTDPDGRKISFGGWSDSAFPSYFAPEFSGPSDPWLPENTYPGLNENISNELGAYNANQNQWANYYYGKALEAWNPSTKTNANSSDMNAARGVLQRILGTQQGQAGQGLMFIWMPGGGNLAGHVATAVWDQEKERWIIVISPFPGDGNGNPQSKPVGQLLNITNPKELIGPSGEGHMPDYAFLIDNPNMGAFAAEALKQLSNGLWAAHSWVPNSTQCAVASSAAFMTGGAAVFRTDGRTPFGLPSSLAGRLLRAAQRGGEGVRFAQELIDQVFK